MAHLTHRVESNLDSNDWSDTKEKSSNASEKRSIKSTDLAMPPKQEGHRVRCHHLDFQ